MQCLAAVNNAELFHQLNAAGNIGGAGVGVGFHDHLIGRLVVAVQVVVPADQRCIDKLLHHFGFVFHQIGARLDRRAVSAETVVGQQMHHRIKTGLGLDADRLADAVALLGRFFIGKEWAHIERVGLEVFVLEAVFGLHPLPEAELPVLADENRVGFGQVAEFVKPLPGVCKHRLRVFLEDGRHHRCWHAVFHVVKTQQQVATHQEVNLADGQKRAVVDLRAALLDFHIQSHFLVGAINQRLIKAAVTGLRLPVCGEHHFFL